MASIPTIWKSGSMSAVCFDVDSTVCTDEAIDRLAEFCGVGEEVSEWYVPAFLLSANREDKESNGRRRGLSNCP